MLPVCTIFRSAINSLPSSYFSIVSTLSCLLVVYFSLSSLIRSADPRFLDVFLSQRLQRATGRPGAQRFQSARNLTSEMAGI